MTRAVALADGGNVEYDQLVHRVAGARKVNDREVRACIGELAAEELVEVSEQDGTAVTVTVLAGGCTAGSAQPSPVARTDFGEI